MLRALWGNDIPRDYRATELPRMLSIQDQRLSAVEEAPAPKYWHFNLETSWVNAPSCAKMTTAHRGGAGALT